MNYTLNLKVPGTYLGSKVGSTLAGLSNTDLEKYTVDLPVKLTGNFTNPQVSLNTQQAVSSLTQQLVATQKDKFKQQGEDKIKDVLGGILKGNKPADTSAVNTAKDSTQTSTQNNTAKAVKDVLGGLFGKKKTATDTTKTNN